MIRQLENFEFNEKKDMFKYIFGVDQGHENGGKFEINFNNDTSIALTSNGLSKPLVYEWDEKYVIIINNELHFLDKSTVELLKSLKLDIAIYEAVQENDLLYVFGEIDILVLNKALEIIKQIKLKDILVDYSVQKGDLSYTTSEGETVIEKIF